MEQKAWVTEQIARFQTQLITCQSFKGVGSLAPRRKPSMPPKTTRLVDMHYFWGPNFYYDVPRGPFGSSHDWLLSHLEITETGQYELYEVVEGDEERYQIEARLELVSKLAELLPRIFPRIIQPAKRTILCHGDLHASNILVADDGRVTGIIDWELAGARPVWLATRMPQFLRGHRRNQMPDRNDFGSDWTAEDDSWIAVGDEDGYIGSDGEVDDWKNGRMTTKERTNCTG